MAAHRGLRRRRPDSGAAAAPARGVSAAGGVDVEDVVEVLLGERADLDRIYAQIAQEKGRVVKGIVFTAQKALPLMPVSLATSPWMAVTPEPPDGVTIILNGSIASVQGTPASSVYSATKAAGIRVNVVSPGPIDTPGVHDAFRP